MNRSQVIERLNLGRAVEAEANPDPAGRRVFVEVRPIVSEQDAYVQAADIGVEPLMVRRSPNIDSIAGYRVRYCALNQGWEDEPDDWDRYVYEQRLYECRSIEELESKLSKSFGLLLSSFQVPSNTESPL